MMHMRLDERGASQMEPQMGLGRRLKSDRRISDF